MRTPTGRAVAAPQRPLPALRAWSGVARCVLVSAGLVATGRLRHPHDHLGRVVRFADRSSARVYRETVVRGRTALAPAALVVAFRLRGVHHRGHGLFRLESWLNVPLFVGFPGFVSKLWLAHDENEVYRGLYAWDGPERAVAYARALWRVLALVSVRGSIRYHVVTGVVRDDLLRGRAAPDEGGADWWRPTTA